MGPPVAPAYLRSELTQVEYKRDILRIKKYIYIFRMKINQLKHLSSIPFLCVKKKFFLRHKNFLSKLKRKIKKMKNWTKCKIYILCVHNIFIYYFYMNTYYPRTGRQELKEIYFYYKKCIELLLTIYNAVQILRKES